MQRNARANRHRVGANPESQAKAGPESGLVLGKTVLFVNHTQEHVHLPDRFVRLQSGSVLPAGTPI
jgi:hypothetical protein